MRICATVFEMIQSRAMPLSDIIVGIVYELSVKCIQITPHFKITAQNNKRSSLFTDTMHCDLSLSRYNPELIRLQNTKSTFYQTVLVPRWARVP